jgi:hypothetical protein
MSFVDLHKLQENSTQAFLVGTEHSISKRMCETRGYFKFAIDVSEEQISYRAGERLPPADAMVQLAEKALYVAKLWNKLQCKVKHWGGFLSFVSKPYQTLPVFEMVSGNNAICLNFSS